MRRNEAVPILGKVRTKGEPTLDARVSSRKPFGLATNFKGKSAKTGLEQPVKLFENQRIGWIERKDITVNPEWIDEWKILMTDHSRHERNGRHQVSQQAIVTERTLLVRRPTSLAGALQLHWKRCAMQIIFVLDLFDSWFLCVATNGMG